MAMLGDKIMEQMMENDELEEVSMSAANTLAGDIKPSGYAGRWGEDGEGDGVCVERAVDEFEEVRRTFSKTEHLTQTPSRATRLSRTRTRQTDIEENHAESAHIDLEDYLQRTNRQAEESGIVPKRVGVSFRNLTVKGFAGGRKYARTFTDDMVGVFGKDVYDWVRARFMSKGTEVKIIQGFSGHVKPAEMLLVLARPGSGSSTFLRALTNQRRPFTTIEGDICYSGIDFELAKGKYRGEILFNDEDDIHFPTLTVDQTLRFAMKTKTPHARIPGTSRPAFVETMLDLYASMFGMKHTLHTLVGNAFVRGVSGGERKRVSIIEALASRATINAWDNSTRGLDSSTAVDYIRSLRILTTLTHATTIVTLYQAGESIYREFDKVCLIDSGRQIFYGKASEARAYFEELGYAFRPRSTTADFLTSITDVKERSIREGYEDTVPLGAEALEAAFRKSVYFQKVEEELVAYDQELMNERKEEKETFDAAVAGEKSKRARKTSPYTVSFPLQVFYATQREFQLQIQDTVTLRSKIINGMVLSLILGSLFYNIPQDSSGVYLIGGSCFFSVVVIAWLQFSEGFAMINSRDIVTKQTTFAFYRPAALLLARTIADLPMMTVVVVILNIVIYFLAGLDPTASKFFIHLLFSWITTFCVTTFYRAVAAWVKDSHGYVRLALLGLNIMTFFSGYMQPRPVMRVWYRWVSYATPVAYAQEAVMSNQFYRKHFPCDPSRIVPNIPGANVANQVCSVPGAVAGSLTFSAEAYAIEQYGYTRAHLWRNFGIIILFLVFFILVGVWGVETANTKQGGASSKVFIKTGATKKVKDVEGELPTTEPAKLQPEGPAVVSKEQQKLERLKTKTTGRIYTWQNVNYTINGIQILHDISGYVKPGQLTALMGASGAGKTTLLDNLAQRKRTGITSGDLRIDGKPLRADFERSTGFVEQSDVHLGTATVREALTFSAMLRQPKSVSKEDKIEYVEEVIRLLELEAIADAIIDPLNVEEKKRVTIGVELAARPETLLFLDEPTSGLDANGALSIVRFLRKLANETGLAILCTIHQPSSILFQNFDDILLLARGGRTVYFGPIGENGSQIINYFQSNGADLAPDDANPAEYILDTVRHLSFNWPQVWFSSKENRVQTAEIEHIIETRSAIPLLDSELRPLTYAMSLPFQIVHLTQRVWRHYNRTPSYGYSKMFSSFTMALLIGILFFQQGDSIVEMQSRGFATFTGIILLSINIPATEPMFLDLRNIYETRERNSRIYSAPAFITAMLLCEIPYSILGSVFFFFPWFYMVGFPTSSSVAGYEFFLILLFEIFIPHLGMIIAAICPNHDIVSIVNPFVFSATITVTGILVPHAQLAAVYRQFVYYINPVAYLARGLIGNVIHGVAVVCAPQELVRFDPPSGLTCAEYAGGWLSSNGVTGSLQNPNATTGCGYCQFLTGDEYLKTININFDDRWNYLGMFVVFIFTNFICVYLAYWLFREVRWGKLIAKHTRKAKTV